ncbi:MAG: hypothetical protein J6V72_05255 [Kiritimatiellae bacterium]|nr:hypothetical protein [Kiritimatiellia bacterium]
MANRFALKSGTLRFGTAIYDAASIIVLPPETREAVDVTATSDEVHQYIKGALKNNDEITLTLYMKPSDNLTVDMAPAAFSVDGTLEDGITTPDPTISLDFNRAIITKVSPPYLEATGDRKAVYDVTFQPDGSTAAQGNS